MAKNVIIMIGDGMGWEITRAAAIQKAINEGATGDSLADFYTEEKGAGLNLQELSGFTLATTGGTFIDGSKNISALEGDPFRRETGVAVIREGYALSDLPGLDENGNFQGAQVVGFAIEKNEAGETVFVGTDADGNPLVDAEGNHFEVVGSNAPILGIFDPGFDERAVFALNEAGDTVQVGGFINAYDPTKGPARPWLPHPELDYVKNLFPDSANTATTLYTAVKSYNAAIGVDIYEDDLVTLGDTARATGKSFGVVTSVPFNHATPAAAIGHVSHRNKLNEEERIVNNEVVLDEFGVPLHEDHSGGAHEGEPVFVLDENGNPIPVLDDNILYDILNHSQPEVVLGGGHYLAAGGTEADPFERYLTVEAAQSLRNGETIYTFVERGANAAEVLADTAASIDVNNGEKLFGVYGARGQGGNLPWLTADGDYSNLGLPTRLGNDRPLAEGETVEEFIASEIDANPTLTQLTLAALDVLGDDNDGFWLSIEGGDIDWAMHDNNLDNSIGALLSFDMAVGAVQDWIAANGGYEENLLLITADHDHYFTLNDDFPTQLREFGAEALTVQIDENGQPLIDEAGNRIDQVDTAFAGHYWGSDPAVMNGWAHHTAIPVPVYYEGAGADLLTEVIGTNFEQYGFEVPGIEGHVDQVHLAQVMESALLADVVPFSELIDLTGIDGEVAVNVTVEREAAFDNVLRFYETDALGRAGGLLPGEAGYEEAVAANLLDAELFVINNSSADLGLTLVGGTYYAPALLINGSLTNLATIEDAVLGSSRIRREGNVWSFEDWIDNDFNDLVVTLNSAEPVAA